MAKRVWTIPAERMKAKKEHRVPLSDAAIAVLSEMRALRDSEFVFSSHRRADRAINIDAPMRPLHPAWSKSHRARIPLGVQRLGCGENRYPARDVEAALAQQVGSAVERTYRRTDWLQKRHQLLDMAESELSVLSSQCLDRRIPDQQVLKQEVEAWVADRNSKHAKANWLFATANARVKLKSCTPYYE